MLISSGPPTITPAPDQADLQATAMQAGPDVHVWAFPAAPAMREGDTSVQKRIERRIENSRKSVE
jgi:hypothetical protein